MTETDEVYHPTSPDDPYWGENATPSPVVSAEPDPEPSETPLEVVSVDELLDRLTQSAEDEPSAEVAEDDPQVETTPAPESTGALEVMGMDIALDRLESIQQTIVHPIMTTSFADYTVAEGLLLLLLLGAVSAVCIKLIKAGFSWLLS